MSNKFEKKVCDVLNEHLTVHQRPGTGGKTYPYIKGEDVIQQMNKAFSHSWSSRVLEDRVVEDQILVRLEVSAYLEDGSRVFHEGFGSSDIARFKGTGKPVNVGNSYKSAFTSALKKACEQFGVGLNAEEETSKPSYSPPPNTNNKPLPTPTTETGTPGLPTGTSLPKVSRKSLGGNNTKPLGSPSKLPNQTAPKTAPQQTGADPITSAQLGAIEKIIEMRKLDPSGFLKSVLPETNKTSLEELTKNEAVKVIRNAISNTGA